MPSQHPNQTCTQIFSCLTKQTKVSIFLIQAPFWGKQVVLGSYGRDGHGLSFFERFQELWFFEQIFSPNLDFDYSFPLTGFWTHESWLSDEIWILFSFPCFINWFYLEKSPWQPLGFTDMPCLANGLALQPMFSFCCWPNPTLAGFLLIKHFVVPKWSPSSWKDDWWLSH